MKKLRKSLIGVLISLISVLCCLFALSFVKGNNGGVSGAGGVTAEAAEPTPTATIYYGVDTNGLLTISNDASAQTGSPSGNFKGSRTTKSTPFANCATVVKSVKVEGAVAPASVACWFQNFTELVSVDLTNLEYQFVTSLRSLFSGCTNLTSVNFGPACDTSAVTDMYGVFQKCNNLKSLDLSGFKTKNVTTFNYMFENCYELETLDLSGFTISSSATFTSTFVGFEKLNSITLSPTLATKMPTLKFTRYSRYVNSTPNMAWTYSPWVYENDDTPITAITGFSKAGTYRSAINFELYWGITGTKFTVSDKPVAGATNGGSFYGKEQYFVSKTEDNRPWKAYGANITDVEVVGSVSASYLNGWFYGFTNLTNLNMTNLVTRYTYSFQYMFSNCTSLSELDLSKFDMANVNSVAYMLERLDVLTKLNISQSFATYITANNKTPGFTFLTDKGEVCNTLQNITPWVYQDGTENGKIVRNYLDLTQGGVYVNPFNIRLYWGVIGTELIISDSAVAGASDGGSFSGRERFSYSKSSTTGGTITVDDGRPWKNCINNVKSVRFTGSVRPAMMSYWFMDSPITAVNFDNLDTTYLSRSDAAFYNCSKLSKLDLSSFNVNAMYNIGDCLGSMLGVLDNLTSITISDSLAAAGNFEHTDFNLPTAKSPWVYEDGTANEKEIHSDTEMTMAGTYIRPLSINLYWNFNATDGKLTITDEERDGYGKFSGNTSFEYYAGSGDRPWEAHRTDIKSVVFDGRVAPMYMGNWFYDCTSLVDVDLSGLYSKYTLKLYNMFYGCTALKTINATYFNTKSVDNFTSMFRYCRSIDDLDLSSFEISDSANCETMVNNMALKSIKLSASAAKRISGTTFANFESNKFLWITEEVPWLYNNSTEITSSAQMNKAGLYTNYLSPRIYWGINGTKFTLSDSDFDGSQGVMPGNRLCYAEGSGNVCPWYGSVADVTDVEILGKVTPAYTAYWFSSFANLKNVNLGQLDTSRVVSFCRMFQGCSAIETLDLSSFDTSKATDMSYMFSKCEALSRVTLTSFNTAKVTSFAYMFNQCTSLPELDLSSFDVSASVGARDYTDMFYRLSSIKKLKISESLAKKVKDMNFTNGKSQTMITESTPWTYEEGNKKITSADQMQWAGTYSNPITPLIYWGVSGTKLTISNKDFNGSQGDMVGQVDRVSMPWSEMVATITEAEVVGNVAPAYLSNWFNGCTAMTKIDLSGLDTSNALSFKNMFRNCSSITSLDLSSFDTSLSTSFEAMFDGCTSLESVDLSSFNTSKSVSFANMFDDCGSLKSLNVSNFDTSKSTAFGYMFYNCGSLKKLDLSNFTVKSSAAVNYIVYKLTALKSLTISASLASLMRDDIISNVNSKSPWYYVEGGYTEITAGSQMNKAGTYLNTITANIYWRISGGDLLISDTELAATNADDIVGSFPGKRVELSSPWASYAKDITSVKFSGDVCPACTANWFSGFEKLTSIDFTGLDLSNVLRISNMFYGCSSLTSLDLSSLDFSRVTNASSMLYGCILLTKVDLGSFEPENECTLSGLLTSTPCLQEVKFSNYLIANLTFKAISATTPWNGEDGSTATSISEMNAGVWYKNPYSATVYWRIDADGILTLSATPLTLADGDLSGSFEGTKAFTASPWTDYADKIVGVKISGTVGLKSTAYLFKGLTSLESVDLTGLDTAGTGDMRYMFDGCTALTTITFGDTFTTAAAKNLSCMFNNCSALTELDLGFVSLANATSYSKMLSGLNLTKITISADMAGKMTALGFEIPAGRPWCHFDGSGNKTDINSASDMTMAGLYTGVLEITFMNGEENLGTSYMQPGASDPGYTGATPEKDGEGNIIYTSFDKWVDENGDEVDFTTLTSDTTVYASFKYIKVLAPEGSSIIYNQQSHPATLESTEAGTFTITYEYSTNSSTGFAACSDTVTAGYYRASVTFNGKTAVSEVYRVYKIGVNITGGVTATDKVYDGTTNVTINASGAIISNVLTGDRDDLTVAVSGAFVSANASDSPVNVTLSGWSLSGDMAKNYYVLTSGNQANCQANITKKDVSIAITSAGGGVYGSVSAATAKINESGVIPSVVIYYDGATDLPVNVGSYAITVDIDDKDNFNLTNAPTDTLKITCAQITSSMIAAIGDQTYAGAQITPKPVVTFNGATLIEDTDYTLSYGANVNVADGGTVTVTGIKNFDGSVVTVNFNITKKQLTVTITTGGGTYSETITPATFTVDGYFGAQPVITLSYSGNGYGPDGTAPTEAGTYAVEAVLDSSETNYSLPKTTASFVVDPKEVNVTVNVTDREYDGSAIALSVYADVDGVISYNITGDNGYNSNAAPTNAGTYTVVVTASSNYKLQGDVNKTFNINKKKVTVTIETDAYTEATVKAATAEVKGYVDGETAPEIVLTYYSGSTALAAMPTTIGDYIVKVTLKNPDGNYVLAGTTQADFIISSAVNSWTTQPSLDGWTYGEAAKSWQAAAEKGTVTVEYKLETDGDDAYKDYDANKPTEAGDYVARFSVPAVDGYAKMSKLVSFKISPKDVTVTITPNGGKVGSVKAATAEVNGYVDGEPAPDVKLTYYNGALELSAMPTTIGTYTVQATISDPNYNLTGTTSAEFKVLPADNAITAINLDDWTYGESANTPTAVATANADKAVFTYYSDAALTNAVTPENAGTYYVKATIVAEGDYAGAEFSRSFTINKKQVTVSGITANNKTYDGKTDATLDYTSLVINGVLAKDSGNLSATASGAFADADAADNKTVTISGITLAGSAAGNYELAASGNQTDTAANIEQAEITESMISVDDQTYTGAQLTPTANVTFNGTALTKDTDYTVTYGANVNVADGGTVTVAGTGNFKGSVTKNFTINAADISGATIDAIADQPYTGSQITPAVTVTFNGTALTKDTDYTVTYGTNVNVADGGTVTIAGTGNFTGSVTKNFTITPIDISSATIGAINDQTHTGSEVKPAVVVTFNGATLGSENYTVSYFDNTEVGTATVTVTGKGNYTGSVTANFNIVSSDNEWTTTPTLDGWTYGETASTPNAAVRYGTYTVEYAKEGDSNYVTYLGNEPTEAGKYVARFTSPAGADYAAIEAFVNFTIEQKEIKVTVTASDGTYTGSAIDATVNTEAQSLVTLAYAGTKGGTTPVNADDYTVTATLNNANYKLSADSVTSATFTIEQADISSATIADLSAETYTGSTIEPDISASFNGATLVKNTDYTLSYADNTNKGEATVTIAGAGNFKGTTEKKFTVNAADISSATIDNVDDQSYTGSAIEPDISASFNGTTLVKDTDYTLSYADNTNKGTATITVMGTGNYTGSVNVSFEIVSSANSWTTAPSLAGWTYGETAGTPNAQAKFGNDTLVVEYRKKGETAYVTYSGNEPTEAGEYEAKFTVAATSEYGSLEKNVDFTISKKQVTVSGIGAQNKTYDGKTDVTLDYTSLVINGVLAKDSGNLSATASGAFADADAADNKTVTISGITLTGSAVGNYELAASGNQTDTTANIEQAEITESMISLDDQTYTGAQLTPTANVTFNGTALTKDTDFTVTYGANVNVADGGTVTVAGTGNFKGSVTKNFTINAADISSATIDNIDDQTYTGSAVEPAVVVTFNGATLGSENYTVSYGNNTEVGTATVTVTGTGNYMGSVSASFEIVSSANSWTTEPALDGWTYGDSAKTATAEAKFGNDTLVVEYRKKGDSAYVTYAGNEPTEAGEYEAKFTVAATSEYGALEAVVDFTIEQKEIKVELTAAGGTYTGSAIEATVNSEAENLVTLAYAGTKGGTTPVNADDYTVTATLNNANYKLSADSVTSATFTIEQAEITESMISVDDQTYTGAQLTPTVTVTFNGATLTKDTDYTVTYGENISVSNGGTVTVAGTGNFKGSASVTFNIAQADNSWTTEPALDGWTYGDSAKTATAEAKFGNDTLVVEYRKKGDSAYVTYAGNEPTEAGEYEARFTVAATSDYGALEKTVDFTISKKQVTVSGIGAQDKTYDGTTDVTLDYTSVTINGVLDKDKANLSATASGAFANANAGDSKTVTISGIALTGDAVGNYELANGGNQTEATANVTPKQITVTGGITAEDKVYDGKCEATLNCGNATLDGVISGDEVTVTASGAFTDKNAANGKTVTISGITLAGSAADNYVLAESGNQTEATANITPKKVAAVIKAYGWTLGEEHEPISAEIVGLVDGETVEISYHYTGKSSLGVNYDSDEVPSFKGEFKVTVSINDTNYALDENTASKEFLITKKTEDAGGNGSIDIPNDEEFEFVITRTPTTTDYKVNDGLGGLSCGYTAQLWQKTSSGIIENEFEEVLKCNLKFRVPENVMEQVAHLQGDKIKLETLSDVLDIYYRTKGGAGSDGELAKFDEYRGYFVNNQGETELWVAFTYDAAFAAEIVFNVREAEIAEEPTAQTSTVIPWWCWLFIGLISVAVVSVSVALIVVASKKRVMLKNESYDDAALKDAIKKQNKRIEELENRDDGGFNAPYDGPFDDI